MLYKYISRLNKLPLELKYELGTLVYQRGMLPMSRKAEAVRILKKYGIDFIDVGTGTNRFIVRYDGFALKIALDTDGVADNIQEYAISDSLGSGAAIAYELSRGGHLLVAEYCPAFSTYMEMYNYRDKIIPILRQWSQRFLLGDVGISKINYANWGLRGVQPKCIDYAYLFPSKLNLFQCLCGEYSMEFTDNTFTTYKCTCCGRIIDDSDLRQRVTQAERIKLFKNVAENSLELTDTELTMEIDDATIPKEYNPDAPDIFRYL